MNDNKRNNERAKKKKKKTKKSTIYKVAADDSDWSVFNKKKRERERKPKIICHWFFVLLIRSFNDLVVKRTTRGMIVWQFSFFLGLFWMCGCVFWFKITNNATKTMFPVFLFVQLWAWYSAEVLDYQIPHPRIIERTSRAISSIIPTAFRSIFALISFASARKASSTF